jgi:hypothetical protein
MRAMGWRSQQMRAWCCEFSFLLVDNECSDMYNSAMKNTFEET